MSHDEKISGPTLCGFGDFFEQDQDVTLGVAKKATLATRKGSLPAPTKSPYPLPKHNPTVEQHGKLLVAANATLKKTAQAATAAARAAKTKLAPQAHLGAAIATAVKASKPLTAKQKQAISKAEAAVKKHEHLGQLATKAAQAARTMAIALAKKMKDQKGVAIAIRQKGGATRVRGVDLLGTAIGEQVQQSLQEYYTFVGASPDPANPGFLDDGAPDPAFAPVDASVTDGSAILNADINMPAPPPMDTHFTDMSSDPKAVGAIPYDGSRGTPEGFVGSLRLFTRESDDRKGPDAAGMDGTDHYGFVFGRTDAIPYGDSLQSGTWNHVHGGKGRHDFWEATDPDTAHGSSFSRANPNGVSYGPIVGNPKNADFRALRSDDHGNLFWLPQEAPDWATWPLKQAAALTAKAEKEARDAQAKADAATQAKMQADAVMAQAQQDAANALAESQATSQSHVAQTQAQAEQMAQDSQANQLMLEQTKAQAEQQGEDAKIAAQQRQLDIEQQRQAGQVLIEQAKAQQAQAALQPLGPAATPADAQVAEEGVEGDDEGATALDLPPEIADASSYVDDGFEEGM